MLRSLFTRSETTTLPPDDAHRALGNAINRELRNSGTDCRVDFFQVKHSDYSEYGVVYQYGPKRATVLSENPFFDKGEIIKSVLDWKARVNAAFVNRERWTSEPQDW